MTETPTYLHLFTLTAPKTSLNARGGITYAVLKDADSTEVYFTLLANSGGSGCFGREIVPLARIQACLEGLDPLQTIPAQRFRAAFLASKSVNNGGFLVACLRHQALLKPAPDSPHQHVLGEDWGAWKERLLEMASTDVFSPPGAEPAPAPGPPPPSPEGTDPPVGRKKAKAARKAAPAVEAGLEGGGDDHPA